VELLATSGVRTRRRFCWTDCAASNIGATIQQDSLSSMQDSSTHANARDASPALEKLFKKATVSGSLGISHTRWATHGRVIDENAHPHFDASGKLALVHNGVIENYQALKDELVRAATRNFAPTLTRRCSRI
jgi:glucosamine 6-phosphate synthetase-like amidotransferase/phosphosugar isomerase protein